MPFVFSPVKSGDLLGAARQFINLEKSPMSPAPSPIPNSPRLSRSAALVRSAGLAVFVLLAQTVQADDPSDARTIQPVVRCAVIGGMVDTDLWPEVCRRFEKATGLRTELVAHGPKREIAAVFERGEADLITMHASDTIINLVADGYGVDPQPWACNDLLLVGPKSDPAGIRGEKDVALAVKKLVASKSKLLLHASLGANEVMADILSAAGMELDLDRVISLPADKHKQMLQRAQSEEAYTLVGRIPFLNAKIPSGNMGIMVQGDARLRRPYVVVVARPSGQPTPVQQAARRLAEFLRSAETQAWLGTFGKGEFDDQPLFFPVALERPKNP